MASKAEVSSLFDGWKLKQQKTNEHKSNSPSFHIAKEKKKIPLLIFSNITRNGMMSLTFNQKIIVPGFLSNTDSKTTKRNLLAIESIDVSNILDLKFVLKSKVNPKDIIYSLELKEWTEKTISIFINFTDPLLISMGDKRDTVFCIIENPKMFIS